MAILAASPTVDVGGGSTIKLEIEDVDLGSDTGNTLRVTGGPVRYAGRPNTDNPLKPLIKSRIEFRAWDKGRVLYDAIDGRPDTDFRLNFYKDSNLYFKGVIKADLEEVFSTRDNPSILFAGYDGLQLLSRKTFDLTGTVDVAQWIYDILSGLPYSLELHTYASWEQDGQNRQHLNGLRLSDTALTHGLTDPTYLEVLERITETFALQLFQYDGKWWAVQRSYRLENTLIDEPVGTLTTIDQDLRRTLNDADIAMEGGADIREPKRRTADPLPSAKARYEFSYVQFQNGEFEDGETGWNFSGATHVSDTDSYASHTTSTDFVSQEPTESLYDYDNIGLQVTFRGEFVGSSFPAQDIGQARFHDTHNDQFHYLAENGTWSTTTTNVSTSSGQQGFDIDIAADPLPGSGVGTLRLRTFFDRDPDGDGTNEVDELRMYETRMFYGGDRNPFIALEYEVQVVANDQTRRSPIDLTTGIGDSEAENPVDEVMEYYDGDAGDPWKESWDFSTDTGRQPFHEERLADVVGQQSQRLDGFDLFTMPDVDQGILYTPVRDSKRYNVWYEEEHFTRRLRRLGTYEIRLDAIGTIDRTQVRS